MRLYSLPTLLCTGGALLVIVMMGLVPAAALGQAGDPDAPSAVLEQAINAVRDACAGIGPPRVELGARIVEASPSQQASLRAVGIDLVAVLFCEKQLPASDRPPAPGYGVLNLLAYVARVTNPTEERVTQGYAAFTSVLRTRASGVREMPVAGVGSRAVELNGTATHASGQQLDYAAVSAMTKRMLFGAETKREQRSRSGLIPTVTSQLSRALDAQGW